MEVESLSASRRQHLGTKHTRRLRQNGQIPAIMYGHGEDPVPVTMSAHDIENVLHHHSRVVSVNLDSRGGQYLIKAVQYDHLGTTPIHLDLMRVDMDERVTVEVQIQLRGTPKGSAEGGVLEQLMTTVEVECMVTNIPEELRASVKDLGLGDFLSVGDIVVPEGVKILAEAEDRVAVCREPAAVVEEEEAPEEMAEGAAEPERITRRKEDEESAEG